MTVKRKRGRPKGSTKEPTKQLRIPIKLFNIFKEIISLFKAGKLL